MEKSKCLVKIVFVTGHPYPPVIGFDFGDFAILLAYDLHRRGGFTAYYNNEYSKYYAQLRYELRWFSKYIADFSFNLPSRIVEEIRNTFRDCKTIHWKKLFSLLESCMPRDILPKFFKE